MGALGVGGSLVDRVLEVVLVSVHWYALGGNILEDRLLVVSLVGVKPW